VRPRWLGYGVMWAVFFGVGDALTGQPVHEAIRYGIEILTGIFIGIAVAKR